MENYHFIPSGVCAREIYFSLDEGCLHDVHFVGGCPGNTSAVSKLLEGISAREAVDILKGNICGSKNTSCADQLVRGVEQALENVLEPIESTEAAFV